MESFEFYNPTKIVFGKNKIAELAKLVPKDGVTMMTYGGGSIKKNGVYDQVKAACKIDVEFGGIEANPDFETLMKAVKICREKKVTFLLAVGGGSILDGTKFIACAVNWDKSDNEWDILDKWGFQVDQAYKPENLIPFGDVLTLPATGSEMNNGGVVSYRKIGRKRPFTHPENFPVFSILDPETTFTLPKRQIANGIIDAFIHTIEQYLSHYDKTTLADYQAEAILKTLVQYSGTLLKEQGNYRAHAEYMWAASWALNGLLACATRPCWATHMLGHELTAKYGLDHGLTLAIVGPHVMRHFIGNEEFANKYKRYAVNVFGCDPKTVKPEDAITKTEEFYRSCGMKLSIRENVPDAKEEDFEPLIENITTGLGPVLGALGDIDAAKMREIYKLSL